MTNLDALRKASDETLLDVITTYCPVDFGITCPGNIVEPCDKCTTKFFMSDYDIEKDIFNLNKQN